MAPQPTAAPHRGLMERISHFFHAEETPFGLALIRVLMPLWLLVTVLVRWPHTRELYSTDGAAAPVWFAYGYSWLLPEPSGWVAVALHTLLVLFLVTSLVGWQTRFSLLAAAALYTWFTMLDSVGTLTKYTVIASHVMLLLGLSPCGAVWSIDAWRARAKRRRAGLPDDPPRAPIWSRRLIQLLIGYVYFGAALTKMQTPAFFSGDQLMSWMMSNVNFEHRLGEYLSMHPALLVVFGYVTVVWEVVFIFIAWSGWRRAVALTLGVLFHAMTFFTLGLYVFPFVCCTLYLAFFNEDEYRRFGERLRTWAGGIRLPRLAPARPDGDWIAALPRLLRAPSAVVFSLTAAAVAAGGLLVEHRLDPYGLRRPEGPYTLRELDPEYVRAMFRQPERVRDVDTFFSLDVGTVLVGGVLLNRREEFRPGDMLTAQCSISPPHEDMWVECNLHDAQDRELERSSQIVSREMLRANFNYTLMRALEPGDYYLVLKKAGTEITRRRIVLHPAAN